MKTAVDKVKKGKGRTVNARFAVICAHYLFDADFEQERAELMPMPTLFDGYVERSAKASSTCLVTVARNRYSVSRELAGQRMSTRLYPSRVEIATDEVIVARHARL